MIIWTNSVNKELSGSQTSEHAGRYSRFRFFRQSNLKTDDCLYSSHFRNVPCPDVKHLLEDDITQINSIMKCCGNTRLHHLVSMGLQEETLQLLNKGANVNVKDKSGQTALHVAVRNTSLSSDIVNIIVEKTSDINAKDDYGRAALHLAVSSANYAAVEVLLQAESNIDIQNYDGNSPLHYAINYCLDLVNTLIEHGANVELKNEEGETPFHIALKDYLRNIINNKGKIMNAMKLLLDRGASIDAQNSNVKKILYIVRSCERSTGELYTFLVRSGAKVHLKDQFGCTPLHYAIRYNSQYLDVILATESGKTAVNIPDRQGNYPLHLASQKSNFDSVKLLLDNGAEVDCKNEHCVTPLHYVTVNKKNCQSIFSLLIERGASPNVQDSCGMTPLHHAVENCNTDMVQLLLENGAKVDTADMCGETPLQISTRKSYDTAQVLISTNLLAKGASPNVYGTTPLHYAVETKSIQLVQLLLENGAKVNSKNKKRETPLHILSSNIYGTDLEKLICRSLLANGALVTVQDDDGMTPLHYAVESHSLDIVELLLENGAEVNCKNKNGETPLHKTTRRTWNTNPSMQVETCKILLANGALVNAENVWGMTPLHFAVYYHSIDIVKLLLENGAELNCKNKNGRTPLYVLIRQCCDTDLTLKEKMWCSTILALGATPNVQDIYGMTPLHNAVENCSTYVVNLLLDYGADVNSKNNKGETPLRYVQSVDTLDLLIQKGARIDEQDNCGRTALHHFAKYAKRKDWNISFECCDKVSNTCKKVLKLLEWGGSPNITDHFGKIPFDYFSFTDVQKEYEIKRSCLYSTNTVARDVQNSSNIQKIQNNCRKEVDRMNLELCGNNSLCDIFIQYDDPTFLSNEELESAVLTRDLKVRFPLYYSLLTSTYHRSRERVQLFDRVVDILQTPLPFEVMRYILTFVDDDSLRNVIKAKEEPPFYNLNFTFIKSETESEIDSDYEYDSPPGPDHEFNFGSD